MSMTPGKEIDCSRSRTTAPDYVSALSQRGPRIGEAIHRFALGGVHGNAVGKLFSRCSPCLVLMTRVQSQGGFR